MRAKKFKTDVVGTCTKCGNRCKVVYWLTLAARDAMIRKGAVDLTCDPCRQSAKPARIDQSNLPFPREDGAR